MVSMYILGGKYLSIEKTILENYRLTNLFTLTSSTIKISVSIGVDMINIPGDYGSGSGTIVRLATALSAITSKPIKINSIRAKRDKPGLRQQHLQAVKAVANLCNAKLKGAEIGSKEIEFYPKKIEAKFIDINIPTAGAIGLLFNCISLPAAFGMEKTIISVKGGATAGLWSSPIPFLENITLPILFKLGYNAEVKVERHGFYPVGGSKVEFIIHPWERLKPIELKEQGEILEIGGISIASKHLEKAKVADRQAKSARKILYDRFLIEPKIKINYVDSACPGSVIVLWIKTSKTIIGSDAIGQIGVRSEILGQQASIDLIKDYESGATVDRYLSDQLLVFMSMCKGESMIIAPKLTSHARTNMWLIKKFLEVEFEVEKIGNNVMIGCSGS
jgi:RNA 3'-phosphate cyclase